MRNTMRLRKIHETSRNKPISSDDKPKEMTVEWDSQPDVDGVYNPDDFYRRSNSITFLYKDRLIWTDNTQAMHIGLVIRNSKELLGVEELDDPWHVRLQLEKQMLVGRIGQLDENKIVVFWNTLNQLHGKLDQCLAELAEKRLINASRDLVYIQGMDDAEMIEDLVDRNFQHSQVDPEKLKQVEILKQLHLMDSANKKRAMKKLGLGGKGRKRPGQPGVKWWAPQSESAD